MMHLATLMLKNFYSTKETIKKGEDMPQSGRWYVPHIYNKELEPGIMVFSSWKSIRKRDTIQ